MSLAEGQLDVSSSTHGSNTLQSMGYAGQSHLFSAMKESAFAARTGRPRKGVPALTSATALRDRPGVGCSPWVFCGAAVPGEGLSAPQSALVAGGVGSAERCKRGAGTDRGVTASAGRGGGAPDREARHGCVEPGTVTPEDATTHGWGSTGRKSAERAGPEVSVESCQRSGGDPPEPCLASGHRHRQPQEATGRAAASLP